MTNPVPTDRFKGHMAMIGFATMIAGSFSLGPLALPHIDPLPLNALRFISGAAVLGFATYGLGKHRFVVPKAPWRFAITGALMGFYFISMFIALTMTTPVATSAVFTLTPLVTAALGYVFLRQYLTRLMAISLMFAAVGSIWVIFRGDIEALMRFEVGQGEIIYFLGCICHAVFAILLRKFARGEPTAVLTFYTVAMTAVWITLFSLPDLIALDYMALPPIVWVTIAYLAVFPTAITFFLIQYASHHLPASNVMAYGYLVPTVVITYEGLLGHGWVSAAVGLGALVTIMGLVVLYFAPEKGAA